MSIRTLHRRGNMYGLSKKSQITEDIPGTITEEEMNWPCNHVAIGEICCDSSMSLRYQDIRLCLSSKQ